MALLLNNFTTPLTKPCPLRLRRPLPRSPFVSLRRHIVEPHLVALHSRQPHLLHALNADNDQPNSGIEIEDSKDDEVTNDVPNEAPKKAAENSGIEIKKSKDDEVTIDVTSEAPKKAAEVDVLQETLDSTLALCKLYWENAQQIFAENSEKLKNQLDDAVKILNEKGKELSRDGAKYIIVNATNTAKTFAAGTAKGYLLDAASRYPGPVGDILEGCASFDEWRNISGIRDFCLGIPYGLFLVVVGFLNFMFTGSIPAVRFSLIPGIAIVALSISSLRLWKNEKNKVDIGLLKAQTAIGTVIFLRAWKLYSLRGSFPRLLMLLISGGMIGFYISRLIIDGRRAGGTLTDDNVIS